MPYIVGLTGGIGSGKSTIATLFAQFNVPIIDADIVARQVVEKGSPLLAEIVGKFGQSILTENSELNRAELRQIVFNDSEAKTWLNQLLHPSIRREMFAQLVRYQTAYVLWVVPLLIENELTPFCDRVLIVDVNLDIQLNRAMQRDQQNPKEIQNIIDAQVDRQTRLSYADDVIENNTPLNENLAYLTQRVTQLHQHYLQLAYQKEQRNDPCKLPDLP